VIADDHVFGATKGRTNATMVPKTIVVKMRSKVAVETT
jgi:hypothetical protein